MTLTDDDYRELAAQCAVQDFGRIDRDGEMVWKCSNCGHICVGKKAPEVCPVCAHPQAYFELQAKNY